MKSWQLEVREFNDLYVLADLLEEEGHPGHVTVRWLIEHHKFPKTSDHLKGRKVWYEEKVTPEYGKHDYLPPDVWRSVWGDFAFFHTFTEAIWAVINYNLYKGHS